MNSFMKVLFLITIVNWSSIKNINSEELTVLYTIDESCRFTASEKSEEFELGFINGHIELIISKQSISTLSGKLKSVGAVIQF